MVRRTHLLDVEKHRARADDVVAQVMHVVDGAVVADVAAVDVAVGDADGEAQVVILQAVGADAPDADGTVELVVLHHARLKLIRYPDGVPRCGRVVILNEPFNLVAIQMAPAPFRSLHLLVAKVILILPCRQKLRVYPAVHKPFWGQYRYSLHRLLGDSFRLCLQR